MLGQPDFYVTLFLGLCLGSFATALSYRLPRGISMVTKAHSACPSCGHTLGVRDLIPLFSWLKQRGLCAHCKAKIGARYPLIELATLLLCIGFYGVYGLTAQGAAMLALAPVIVSIIDIDLHHKIIPDGLNIAVLVLGVLAFVLGDAQAADIVAALSGMVAYGFGAVALRYVCTKFLKREAMGLGDVKFFAAAGFWMGTNPDAAAWFLVLSGGLGVALALAWKKITKEEEFPFGPALVLAFTVMIFCLKPFLFT